MAALAASIPLPLLLDSVLASSWTWVALSVATVATLLRALSRSCFISRPRPRPHALLPPPPCALLSEREQRASFTSKTLHLFPKSIQERGNQSIPALHENLLQTPADGLAFPEVGCSSCMRDCNHAAPWLLADAVRAPKRLSGQPCSVRGESSEGALRMLSQAIDCKSRLRLKVGFLADARIWGSEAQEGGDGSSNPLRTSSDACSFSRKPLQNFSFVAPCLSSENPSCFEMQYGWHTFLDTRWGAPWRSDPIGLARALPPCDLDERTVVKVWSTSQRNLLKALKVEESCVAALDVSIGGGVACSACRNGEVSLWDISNQACLGRVYSSVKPLSALCLNSEKGVIVTGNRQFLRLWDHRSPSLCAPILDGGSVSHFLALQCEGNVLRIHLTNGIFSSCDLRKPQMKFLSVGLTVDSVPVASKAEEDELSVPWEKLCCDDDDEFWDECHIGYGDVPQQERSSFASRCATLVRSLSFSGQ